MSGLKQITIQDKAFFDDFLSKETVRTSELTFTNLFMWREYYGFHYMKLHDTLAVIACGVPEPFALFPFGLERSDTPDLVISDLIGFFSEKGLPARIGRADAAKCHLLEVLGIPCQAETDIANSDYIYLTEDLSTLKGKRYDGKRNHIKRLNREHSVEYSPVTDETLPVVERIFSEWFLRKYGSSWEKEPEWKACRELIQNYASLSCKGILMFVDQMPAAAAIGEKLSADTAVIHLEKAVTFEDGAYPAVNQAFVIREWQDTTYINREQDLGLPGLRNSKRSWHPASILEKYNLILN